MKHKPHSDLKEVCYFLMQVFNHCNLSSNLMLTYSFVPFIEQDNVAPFSELVQDMCLVFLCDNV